MSNLKRDLEEIEESLIYNYRTIRLKLYPDGHGIMQAGAGLDPKIIRFDKLPEQLNSRVALLNMLNKFERIPTMGKNLGDRAYYIYVTNGEWEELKANAIPST